MESRAIQRYTTTSPRKMRLVVDMIRGLSVDDAISYLHFSPKHSSKVIEKVIRSAVSNLMNLDEAKKVDTANIYVKTAFVDEGPTVKRMLPAPMGRAYRVRKRSNHLTVIVAEKENNSI
jgi:large subunit ribosomal protein L22